MVRVLDSQSSSLLRHIIARRKQRLAFVTPYPFGEEGRVLPLGINPPLPSLEVHLRHVGRCKPALVGIRQPIDEFGHLPRLIHDVLIRRGFSPLSVFDGLTSSGRTQKFSQSESHEPKSDARNPYVPKLGGEHRQTPGGKEL